MGGMEGEWRESGGEEKGGVKIMGRESASREIATIIRIREAGGEREKMQLGE